jgi:hypothetical protein
VDRDQQSVPKVRNSALWTINVVDIHPSRAGSSIPDRDTSYEAILSYIGTERYGTPLVAALICQNFEAIHAIVLSKLESLHARHPAQVLFENHRQDEEWMLGLFSRNFVFKLEKSSSCLAYVAKTGGALMLDFLVKS